MGRKLGRLKLLTIAGLTFWAGASAADPMEGAGSDTLYGASFVESFSASEIFTISATYTFVTFSYYDLIYLEPIFVEPIYISYGSSGSFDFSIDVPILSLAPIAAQAVGLPATALLFGTGLFGLAALGRRRSR